MPTKDKHLRQAETNEELADALLKEKEYSEWGIIVLAHSALHYVEAALANLNIHSVDDGDRTINIVDCLEYINTDYGVLWNLSQNICYLLDPVGPSDVVEAQKSFSVVKRLLREHGKI